MIPRTIASIACLVVFWSIATALLIGFAGRTVDADAITHILLLLILAAVCGLVATIAGCWAALTAQQPQHEEPTWQTDELSHSPKY